MNYHGIIIDKSLNDSSIIDSLNILGKKESGNWILFKIEISSEEKETKIKELQEQLKEKYYFHIYRKDELIIIFKEKIFRVTTNKESWTEARYYGKSLDIPEEQLDFLPCKMEDEKY